ncbi:MFS transporter [Domibacillus robiginosus]|uniref:MFS transporter n=1 Tax=Domibacillus robiginosus TaxID=1071054 RepID=UPI0009E216F0|nr:aromatic acid/H+ symport family MFS transporter [Domibacillus robiginosus]
MRKVNASEVVAASRFNKFHLAVFLWCVYAIAFDGFDIAMYGVGLPVMMTDFGLTSVEAGSIGSYVLVGMMAGAFICGPLADTIGRKKVLAICMFLFSVFTFLSGLAPNAAVFTIMRVMAGIGMGGLMPTVIALMSEYSPKKNRALIVATMYCGYSVGGILAALIGMSIMQDFGWRVLYWIGIIPLFTLPFFLKKFPESLSYYMLRGRGDKLADILNRIDPDGNYKENDDYEFAIAKENAKGFPVKKLFVDHRALSTFAFCLAVFSCLIMIYGLNTWLPKIMQESGYALSSSLSFSLVLGVGQIGGSLLGGYFVDRIGHRKVLVSMYVLSACCFIALSFTSNLLLLYVLIAIGGACTVGTQNLSNPYIYEFYPKEVRATGVGFTVGIGRIGAIAAPMVIGFLLTTSLAPQGAFIAFAVPSLLGAIAFVLVREKYGRFDQLDMLEDQKVG